MRTNRIHLAIALGLILGSTPLLAADGADSAAVARIIEEGMERSQVMETLSWMTDVHGPRLTGSPGYRRAAEWAKKKLTEFGLEKGRIEGWGPFGRGWELERYSAHVISPRTFPLISFPKAWSPETDGKVKGEAIYFHAETDSMLQAFKGRLGGKFVLLSEPRKIMSHFTPEASRRTEEDLLKLANAPVPERREVRRTELTAEQKEGRLVEYKKALLAQEEGALALLTVSRGDGGNVFVQQASVPSHPDTPRANRTSPWDPDAPTILPQIAVGAEHYNQMLRILEKGEQVQLEMDLRVNFFREDSGYNILAEIPGTDLKEEVVMVGAHFDSWHGATGTTDNGAGSAVCMEAVRIIKAAGLQPRRTIRIGLWGGEEQGLKGSRAFVKKYLGEQTGPDSNRVTKHKLAAEKLSAYYNLDNGSGKVRGVYMQGNESVRSIFREWLTPFQNKGASTLTLSNTSGTDHVAFDEIGLPGFQFIQDPLEYSSRTHHSTMDTYDRAEPEDLKQASVIMAVFAYHTAMRDERLPRKERKNVVLEWAPEVFSPSK